MIDPGKGELLGVGIHAGLKSHLVGGLILHDLKAPGVVVGGVPLFNDGGVVALLPALKADAAGTE